MIKFIKPHNLDYSDIKAFFTTKALNGNLKDLLKDINLSESDVFLPIQKHTSKIIIIENDLKPQVADAVLTKRKGVLIGIHVADCVPILLFDKEKSLVGAVHAGWRGTAAQILKNTIDIMRERFYTAASDILIAIGPSIRRCCYEVGDEVADALHRVTGDKDYYRRDNGKHFVDLSSANKIQALSSGVPEDNIWQSGECTHCNPDKYYSYRYAKGSAGRQGGFIGML